MPPNLNSHTLEPDETTPLSKCERDNVHATSRALERVRYGTRIAEAQDKFESAHLESLIRVKVRIPLPKTEILVVVFHFRTKLDKKGRFGEGISRGLRDQANRA